MARDLLTPPVSTVPSESVSSDSTRIDERRARLAPKTLEILMCCSTWFLAEK
jgi:hypothetical protein